MGRVRLARSKDPVETTVDSGDLPLSNRSIAELLARHGEEAQDYVRKAYFRAAHAAFVWPVEAAFLVKQDRSLTELDAIGPSLAKRVLGWIESPPEEIPTPPEHRRNFLTMAEARAILQSNQSWRGKLKGDLQMHSTWSDGAGSIQEMAESGIARGYEYISITDHTKGLKIAGGIDEQELREQALEIESVNESHRGKGFRVLRSTEMNLSPTGEGDMDLRALEELDIVLASFHSQLRKTTDQTERYLAALENPALHILGHPRGRVYNYRAGLQADWRRVFARAAELNKAVEVDAYSDRQDLDFDLLGIAREEGTMISFGSDAHHPWQLVFLDLALASALLVGIDKERILNFMPAEKLLAWAKNR